MLADVALQHCSMRAQQPPNIAILHASWTRRGASSSSGASHHPVNSSCMKQRSLEASRPSCLHVDERRKVGREAASHRCHAHRILEQQAGQRNERGKLAECDLPQAPGGAQDGRGSS